MKNKENISKRLKILLSILFISALTLVITYAINHYNEGYKIPESEDNSWKNYKIIPDLPSSYEWKNSCIKVTNYNSLSWINWFFAPTKTKSEWDKFKTWCNQSSSCSIEKKEAWEVFSRVMDWSKHWTCAINNNRWNSKSITCWGKNPINESNATPNLSGNHQYWNPNFNQNKINSIYWRCHYWCALDNIWRLKCWGYTRENWNSSLNDFSPIPQGRDSDLKNIWVGWRFMCWIKMNWKAKCWWSDWAMENLPIESQKDGHKITKELPLSTSPNKNKKIVSIWWAFKNAMCVVYDDWTMECYGVDKIPEWWDTWIKKAEWANDWTICVLKYAWEVNCFWWTNNNLKTNIPTDNNFIDLQTWQHHACALKKNWKVKCWWVNSHKNDYWDQVTWPNNETKKIKAIWIWCYHSCVILEDNNVKCRGYNNKGQSSNIPAFTPYNWNWLCLAELFN